MLAIVIPYYKSYFFESTLASLANQTNQNFIVYIGNDASPEDPAQLIEKYSKKINIVYKRFRKNLGKKSLVKQWDRCIEMVIDEKWIMILGDDDVLEPNVVSAFYDHLPEFGRQTNLVRYSTQVINEKSTYISDAFNHPVWEPATAAHFRRAIGKTRSSLSEYIFRRNAYVKHGFFEFPLAWHSDDRAWLEFSENKPIYTINEARVLVRISQLNISGKTDNEEQKYDASKAFYRYVLRKQLHNYKYEQRWVLISIYRNLIKKTRSLNLQEKLHLFLLHLRNPSWKLFKREFNLALKDLYGRRRKIF